MPERSSWPLLARPEMIDAICRDLLAVPARTTLVTGLAGAGKTTLLEQVAARLRARPRRVVQIVGIAELSTVPLGAMLPLLAGSRASGAAIDERLRALVEELGRDADRVVLLVDDAALLDEISAAAIYQLIRALGVPTLLTARTGMALPAALDRLHHEGALVTRAVPALTHEETAGLLTKRLGGRPTPDLINSLWARTEGNPLFLRGLVEGALARSSPRRTDHGIAVDIDDVADVGTLADRIIVGLDRDARRAAQLLALTSGLRTAELARVGSADAARRLRDAGLATMTDGDTTRLAHPLVADAALRSLGDERGDRVREAAALLADGDALRRLAAVRLLLADGIAPGADRLAEAATTAARTGDHEVCVELARAAIAAGAPESELRWTLGGSLSLLGRLDEADAAFADGWARVHRAEERAVGVSRNGEHLAFRRHDPEGALRLATEQWSSLSTALRTALEPEMRTWRAVAGRLRDAPASTLDTSAPAPVRLRAAMAAVLSDSLAGRGDLAHESAEALAAIEREFGIIDPVAAAMVALEEFFHHLARADGASAWATIERQRSGPLTDAAGLWSYTLGVFCWYDGRLDDGARLAALAVEQLRWRDPTGLLGAAVTLRALLALAAGDAGLGAQLLAELVPAQLGEPRAAMLHTEYAALGLAAEGRPDDACSLLARAGVGALDAGYGFVGALTMSLAIRLGRPAIVRDGLARAAATADPANRLIPALLELADALERLDPEALRASATIVAGAGMRATARDALANAARGLTPGGESRALARAAEGYASAAAASPGGPTSREAAVARLAAERLSNAEIAVQLGVSVRTVENHLTRYYAKTGSSRGRLRAAVTPPEPTPDRTH